jgi:fucose permease
MSALLLVIGFLACACAPDVRPGADEKAPPRFALPPRAALVIGAVGFCGTFAEGGSSDWAAVYLRDVTRASPATAALAYAGFSAAMVTTRLLGDFAVRRLGAVTTLRAGGVVATLGGVLVMASHSPVTAIGGFALLGVGVSTVVPLCFGAAGRRGPVPSQAIAGVATVTYTSGLIAPAAIGGIAGATSLTASFALVTVLTLGLVVGAGVVRTPPRTIADSAASAALPAPAQVDRTG